MAGERRIILRGYVYEKDGGYYGECIDLNLLVKRESMEEAIAALNEAVEGYVETVAQLGLVDELIPRQSPLRNRFHYHRRKFLHDLRMFWRSLVPVDRELTFKDGQPSLA